MIGIGRALQEARLQKGLSLEEMHQKTQISLDYLRALEEEDFSKLPSPFYARGFLRAYARSLQVDPQALLEQFEIHVMEREPQCPDHREMHSVQVRRQQSETAAVRDQEENPIDLSLMPRRRIMAQRERERCKRTYKWIGIVFFFVIVLAGCLYLIYKFN